MELQQISMGLFLLREWLRKRGEKPFPQPLKVTVEKRGESEKGHTPRIVSKHISNPLMMIPMRNLPREIRNQQNRMESPSHRIINPLVL